MKKSAISILLSAVLCISAFSFFGCKSTKLSPNAQKYFGWGSDYYKNVESRHTLNYDENFYDDFTAGIDVKDSWDIADSVWDEWTSHQNGVRPENIMLCNDPENPDSHLIVRANGDFYRSAPIEGTSNSTVSTPLTGGVLSTKRAFGPGRFETRMKIAPRVGALTTMWLFSWLETPNSSGGVDIYQSEVDIEMGLRPGFDKAYFTTWTSNSSNTSRPIDVSPMNDGKFHTYTFDWSVDKNYVDYYIDGNLVQTITENVPNLNATLSLGIWIPSFAGTITSPSAERGGGREFESDYAEFDYVHVIPFEETGWRQRTVTNRSSRNSYSVPTLTKVPVANKISNGDFDYTYKLVRNTYIPKPWTFGTSAESGESAGSGIVSTSDTNSTAKIISADFMRQFIQGTYEGYSYKISGSYKTEGATSPFVRVSGHKEVYIETISPSSFSEYTYLNASEEWTNFSFEFTVKDPLTKTLVLWFGNRNQTGTTYFDNLNLEFLGI